MYFHGISFKYGTIELVPIKGHSVKIPGYALNNGYYSSQLDLIVSDGKDFTKEYDITECQEYIYYYYAVRNVVTNYRMK